MLVITVITVGAKYGITLHNIFSETYSTIVNTAYKTLFSIFVGTLLAVPTLVKTVKMTGQYKYNWLKATAAGLPTLFVTIYPVLYYFNLDVLVPRNLTVLYMTTDLPQTMCGLVFGYLLLTSLDKGV